MRERERERERERAGEHIIRTQLNASTGDVKSKRERLELEQNFAKIVVV